MNTLFKCNYERKGGRFYQSIHKSMIIPVDINQTNKSFYVTVKPKNACKLEFAYHLWLPFLDQPQSDIIIFRIITLHIYIIIVTKVYLSRLSYQGLTHIYFILY